MSFTYCPPASGRHYNASGAGPISPRLYGPDDRVNPQGWIHNLEHGGLVLLYRGDGPGATEDGQAQLRAFFDLAGAGPFRIPYAAIRTVRFTGKDPAAGNSYAAWLRKKEQDKTGAAVPPR